MAKRKSSPNGIIDTNTVWDAATDTYSHTDIKGWLDKFDIAIGALMADRVPLGTVIPWSFPDKGSPDSSALSIPAGYALCNGQTLTSSQHDFPSPFAGVSVVLPDYRNRVLLGADTGGSIRTAGNETTAPKIKGRQGGNLATIPDHFHIHSHGHRAGSVNGTETYHTGLVDNSGGGLNDSPYANPPYINMDAAGSGHDVALRAHSHQLAAFYTSNARDPASGQVRAVDVSGDDGSAALRIMTSLQVLGANPRANGQSTNTHTTGNVTDTPAASSTRGDGGGGASTPGDSLKVSAYQLSEGVYYLMKVKWGSDYGRPWAIRNAAGSVAAVGTA